MTKSAFRVEGVANDLWNEDSAPVEPGERSWNASNVAPVWAAIAISLPLYLFASGMTALGAGLGALLGSVFAGGLAVSALAIAFGHAGVRYGIPFSVLARTAFGVNGAKVTVALQLLASCAWVGIACWLGGETIFSMVRIVVSAVPQGLLWVCFGAFLLVVAAPFGRDWKPVVGVLLGACILVILASSIWIELTTRGVTVLVPVASPLSTINLSPGGGLMLGLTGMLGLGLPVAFGACDLSRRVRSQRAQALGVCAFPLAMAAFGALAATITALAQQRGRLYWDPVLLEGGIARVMFAFGGLVMLGVVALLTARAVCGWLGDRIVGLMPSLMTATSGRWVACAAAALAMPWRWLASPERFVGEWLTGCAGLLAPLAAVVLVEYFVLRRRWLNVDDLYQRDGLYEYSGGWNWRAFGAVAAGWMVVFFLVYGPSSGGWREGAVWIGTAASGLLYWLLRSGPPDVARIPPAPLLIPLEFKGEAASG